MKGIYLSFAEEYVMRNSGIFLIQFVKFKKKVENNQKDVYIENAKTKFGYGLVTVAVIKFA